MVFRCITLGHEVNYKPLIQHVQINLYMRKHVCNYLGGKTHVHMYISVCMNLYAGYNQPSMSVQNVCMGEKNHLINRLDDKTL